MIEEWWLAVFLAIGIVIGIALADAFHNHRND